MMYWDSGAILKLYVEEPDSRALQELLFRSPRPILTSAISAIEVLCALYRKARDGELESERVARTFAEYRADCAAGGVVEAVYGSSLIAEAEELLALDSQQPRPVMIRSLDLIHLATAIAGRAEALVTTDARLRRLASLARLRVLP